MSSPWVGAQPWVGTDPWAVPHGTTPTTAPLSWALFHGRLHVRLGAHDPALRGRTHLGGPVYR